MADHFVKIIPSDPRFRITERQAQEAVQLIKRNILAYSVEARMYEYIEFIDCGQNLERILCPCCHQPLDFGWWGTAMDQAYENHFMDLSIQLPCCGSAGSLNDLIYDFPCGFSSFEFAILSPQSDHDEHLPAPENMLAPLQRLLGIPLRAIRARY